MNRWNSLTVAQRVMAGVGTAVVILGLAALIAYAMGVRCGMEGNYLTCVQQEALAPQSSEETESTPTTIESGMIPPAPLSESSDRPEPVSIDGDAIVVNDQPAGPIVEVTMLTLSQPGWVAVYEDNNGTLGNVLGAARFEEGIHLGEISLLRSTAANRTYYLVLHADTNDREFDLKKNPLITDANGSSIRTSFRTFSD